MSAEFAGQLESIPTQLLADPRLAGGGLAARGRLFLGGLGGSAAAGEFLALALPGIETHVVRDDVLPAWAGAGDALLCLSYSGNTPETLALWGQGGEKGLARGAVASGGRLLAAAAHEGEPRCAVPEGLAPRAALGYLVRAAFSVLQGAPHPDWNHAATHLSAVGMRWSRRGEDAHDAPGPALAGMMEAVLPVFLAGAAELGAVARRWAANLAENAKAPATVWSLPEAGHNRVMALAREAPRGLPLRLFAVGTPRREAARVRYDALRAVLAEHGTEVVAVAEPHVDPWIEMLGLAHAGDWVSLHLARRSGVDPATLSLTQDLKRRQGADSGSERT